MLRKVTFHQEILTTQFSCVYASGANNRRQEALFCGRPGRPSVR